MLIRATKRHRVPLTDAALAILEEMQNFRSGDFVFPGGKVAGHSATWRSYAAAGMGRADCRAWFSVELRDWTAERTGFPSENYRIVCGSTDVFQCSGGIPRRLLRCS
jgi:hypothetical protein